MKRGIAAVVLVLFVFVGVSFGAASLPTGASLNASFLPQGLLESIKSLSLGAQLQFNRYLLRFMKENVREIVKLTQDRLQLMLLMWSKRPNYDEITKLFEDMLRIQMSLSTKFVRYYVEWMKKLHFRDRLKLVFQSTFKKGVKRPAKKVKKGKKKQPNKKKGD